MFKVDFRPNVIQTAEFRIWIKNYCTN